MQQKRGVAPVVPIIYFQSILGRSHLPTTNRSLVHRISETLCKRWMILDEHGDDGIQDDHNYDADQSDQNAEMEVLPPSPSEPL